MLEVYGEELSRAREALECGDFEVCFGHLERAHVLAQRMTGRHTRVHWLMLVAGWRRGDWREVVGQVPRMLASILFSRLWVPRGNTGRARVSALRPMPVPEDLRELVAKIDTTHPRWRRRRPVRTAAHLHSPPGQARNPSRRNVHEEPRP